ncbi:ferritin-like domain-containing protein [Blastococcus sp. URHD0036]|uniref:ferritin-like domain-containing protein n=1 Tax=Blastococcus sp. URHD0036 TaxID=1380356 RepID=UPI0004985006|nr:ferritin-like domain-containing protein [Blastococcus sp. URHD0036]
MADDDGSGQGDPAAEELALGGVLEAEHAAVWGYGVVGAALPPDARLQAVLAENAHRDVRDRLAALLDERGVDAGPAEAAYALPFPVLSPVDAAALAATLESGVSAAWVALLDDAVDGEIRRLAARELGAAEVRAVDWRSAAGQTPTTTPFPGLPPA